MNGKSKCKFLKDIRRQIAQDNDIEYVTSECKFQGDCSGTCPKCEAEVRYLEQELEKRQKAGKAIAVAGIAAALMVGSTGCATDVLFQSDLTGDIMPPETSQTYETTQKQTESPLPGIPGEVIINPSESELQGEPANSNPTEDVLMGDIAIWP